MASYVYSPHNNSWAQSQNLAQDLTEASSHPVIFKPAITMPNGDLVVHISPDGHYYIPGSINGFPIRFLVDSGAAVSSIETRLALNAGMKVGISEAVNTANGQVAIGKTSGNLIEIGSARIANAHIMVMDNLVTALIGAEVLNVLDISYSKGVMTIKKVEATKPGALVKN